MIDYEQYEEAYELDDYEQYEEDEELDDNEYVIGEKLYASKDKIYDIIMETPDAVKKDALSRTHYKCKEIEVVARSRYLLGTDNFSQDKMNKDYLKRHPKASFKPRGTCLLVAATSLMDYYNTKNYTKTVHFSGGIFDSLVDVTVKKYGKTFVTGSGIPASFEPSIINQYYKNNNIKNVKASNEYIVDTNRIKNLNEQGKPVIGHFDAPNGDEHAMVIASYYRLYVKYKTSDSRSWQRATYHYYAVNDGWHSSLDGESRIQYVRAEYLDDITIIK